MNEILNLFSIHTVSVVVASSLMSYKFGGTSLIKHEVKPLGYRNSVELFNKTVKTDFKKYNIGKMLKYAYGLPLLITSIATAVDEDRRLMDNLFYNVKSLAGRPDKLSKKDEKLYKTSKDKNIFNNKIKRLLTIIFNIDNLYFEQKHSLGKMSIFYPQEYTYLFCKWFGIKDELFSNLVTRRWLLGHRDESGHTAYNLSDIINSVKFHAHP